MIFCGAALDHPHLMQAQGVEAHRVLRVVLPPVAVGDLFQRLEEHARSCCVALVHEKPGSLLWLAAAEIRRLQDRAQLPAWWPPDASARTPGSRPPCSRSTETRAGLACR